MDINEYLALMNITRAQAARELGCDPALLWRWCAGITLPGRYWWARIQAWSRGAITADVPKAGTWTATFVSAGKIKPRKREAEEEK